MMHHQIIEGFRPILDRTEGVEAAMLYGSVARQEATPNSDIDVALIVNEGFSSKALMSALMEAEPKPDLVMQVAMRNKVVSFFQGMRLKAEFSIHRNLGSSHEISQGRPFLLNFSLRPFWSIGRAKCWVGFRTSWVSDTDRARSTIWWTSSFTSSTTHRLSIEEVMAIERSISIRSLCTAWSS